ncbi:MAG TPA: copper resistance CopC family protein [Steroidobacteraceae bacterium]|jgi:methionine-rich copper-binding protein CopC|nr:copper resistance CopC family protein [Steroidobacteraceae bacterium]
MFSKHRSAAAAGILSMTALASGLLLMSELAWGHAKLQATVPAADATVPAPKSLSLKFNEEVRLAVLTVSNAGKTIPVKIDTGAAAAREVSVALPILAPGTYEVAWSAMSSGDGHVVKGRFSFTVAVS